MHENVLTVHGSHTIVEIVRVLQTFSDTVCQWLKNVLWKCRPQQSLFFKTVPELGFQSVCLLERLRSPPPANFPSLSAWSRDPVFLHPDDARKSIEKLISDQGFGSKFQCVYACSPSCWLVSHLLQVSLSHWLQLPTVSSPCWHLY